MQMPEDREVALQLFELVTKPRLILKEEPYYESSSETSSEKRQLAEKTGFKVGFPGDAHWIITAWKNVFSPNLKDFCDPLLRLCEKQIHDTYSIQSSIHGSNKNHDSFNWDRSSIERHEQDSHPLSPVFSCLISALRDILRFLMHSNRDKAIHLRDSWWGSSISILKRLAIYSYSIDEETSPDEAIKWLISNKLIYRLGMKKEVFDVLAQFYSNCSTGVKQQLLKNIDCGDEKLEAEEWTPDALEYKKYNVLIWLRRHVTDCELLDNALTQMKTKHPNFSEQEHPEFDHWFICKDFNPSEGFDFDKILSKSPSKFIESLKSLRGDSFRRDQWSYPSNLQKLFTKNHDWACKFIRLLSKEDDISVDIWNSALSALREALRSPDDWKWLLELLEKLPRKSEIYSGIARLISDSIWKEESKPANEEIDRAALLMKEAWDLCSRKSEEIKSVNRDWLPTAINHVGGWISEFWVHYCSHLYNHDRENWKGIPGDIQTILTEAVNGHTPTQVKGQSSANSVDWILA